MRPPLMATLLAGCLLLGTTSARADAPPAFTLRQLEQITLQESPALQASRFSVSAAEARVRSARALPNPDIEYLAGNASQRAATGVPGNVRSYGLTLPLDLPWKRAPRIASAQAGLQVAQFGGRAFEADILAELRLRFFDVLRRDAELKNALADQQLTADVRQRIATRVKVGEAGRFELIKADAEAQNASLAAEAAQLKLRQARTVLQRITGQSLPPDYVLSGQLKDIPELQPLEEISNELQANNPDLLRARAEVERANQTLRLEKALRLPALGLKGAVDEEPDLTLRRVGLTVTVPIFNLRQGPVAEAQAEVFRSQRLLEQQDLNLTQGLNTAYQQYEIARRRVSALETGILRQTQAALDVAQVAYRFGERSFLDVLDAQRVNRAARNDLIAARFELASAWIDIERLRASQTSPELTGATPE